MKFRIMNELFDTFGEISYAAILVEGCSKISDTEIINILAKDAVEEGQKLLAEFGEVQKLSFVQEWRQIFSKMGASPSKKSSVESLYDFIAEERQLPRILPMVDLYNCISCQHGLPMAGYDVEKLEGETIVLRRAKKGEPFEPLGLKQIEKTKNGEVVYTDDAKVICRYWNNKDSNLTKLEPNTEKIVFIIDGAPSVHRDIILEAATKLSNALQQLGCSKHRMVLVNHTEPMVEI